MSRDTARWTLALGMSGALASVFGVWFALEAGPAAFYLPGQRLLFLTLPISMFAVVYMLYRQMRVLDARACERR